MPQCHQGSSGSSSSGETLASPNWYHVEWHLIHSVSSNHRQGVDIADLVPAKKANVKYPQAVIRFYEERLALHAPHSLTSTKTNV